MTAMMARLFRTPTFDWQSEQHYVTMVGTLERPRLARNFVQVGGKRAVILGTTPNEQPAIGDQNWRQSVRRAL